MPVAGDAWFGHRALAAPVAGHRRFGPGEIPGFNGAGGLETWVFNRRFALLRAPHASRGAPGHGALGALGRLKPPLGRPELTRGTMAGSHRDLVGIGAVGWLKALKFGGYSYPQANVALTLVARSVGVGREHRDRVEWGVLAHVLARAGLVSPLLQILENSRTVFRYDL
jgi:hypothetical protein